MLWPLLIIFLHMCHFFNFCKKMQKNENRLCPLLYEAVLEDIIKTVWTEQSGNLKEMRYLGKAALVCPCGKTRVKFCLPTLHFLMGRTEGENGSFMAIRMRIYQNCSSSMTPSWLCPNFCLLCEYMVYLLLLLYCGESMGALMYLKTKLSTVASSL